VSILASLWAAYLGHLRRLHHQFEIALEARVDERTRIAREIHDTLLQSFQGVLLRLEVVSQLLRERPTEAQGMLDSTMKLASESIVEGRDAIQGLRECTVERYDLALAIRTLGEELASESTGDRAAFHLTVEGQPRELRSNIRDEVYRIAGEALRNAFCHAQPQQVEVEIRYDDDQFRLRVRDDGKGMDRAILSCKATEGHYGLAGMRERAILIGGKLKIWSEVGTGTEVELTTPASTAYKAGRWRSWFSRTPAVKA
jgi:signal transduction histidine kinase